jgi:hypothetical protein
VDVFVIRERATKSHLAGREWFSFAIQDGGFQLVEQPTQGSALRLSDDHDELWYYAV